MTAPLLFANNASSRLSLSIDAVTTSISVTDGDGDKFPQPTGGQYFTVTVEDRRTGQLEIMKCVGRSFNTLNVVRAQEGTTAQVFNMYATVSNRLTAATMDALLNAVDSGIEEAPNDTKQYGRKSLGWTEIPDEVVGGRITIGPVAPSSPAVNDVWIDTS